MATTLERWQSLKDDPLVSVREIEGKFGFDPSTIRRWIKTRKLRALRVGGQLRVRQSAILNFIKEME